MMTDTLFLVDESSMIANEGLRESVFGTGCLLDDLVQFVYSGRNCRLVLIGDKAQLPPVGEEESPAFLSVHLLATDSPSTRAICARCCARASSRAYSTTPR